LRNSPNDANAAGFTTNIPFVHQSKTNANYVDLTENGLSMKMDAIEAHPIVDNNIVKLDTTPPTSNAKDAQHASYHISAHCQDNSRRHTSLQDHENAPSLHNPRSRPLQHTSWAGSVSLTA
jgi:hypothetical protein